MSFHIQMSDEAMKRMKRIAFMNSASSLLACLAFMAIGGAMLYFTVTFIQSTQLPAFESYVSPTEDAPPSKKPQVKELTTKTSPPTSQVSPNVIVGQSASPVAMAEIEIASVDVGVGTTMDMGLGLDSALGSGLGESGGGLGSNDASGSALEGTMYDFKLTRRGAKSEVPSNPAENKLGAGGPDLVGKILGDFLANSWNPKKFDKYYRSKTKLYASHIFIPMSDAAIAPKAFNAEDTIDPCGWCIIYRGKVKAPKTGRFCFMGWGDDGVAVRFNKKLAFEGGQFIGSFYGNPKVIIPPCGLNYMGNSKEYQENMDSYPGHEGYQYYDTTAGQKAGGNIIEVKEGEVYPIEIMICEIPGGTFSAYILIADLDAPRTDDGKLVVDLFRTNFSFPDNPNFSSYSKDSLIWTVVP